MDPATTPLPSEGPPATMPAALRARAADSATRPFLRFEERSWTFGETFAAACRYAQLFLRERDPARPFHVGVLMDNRPEFLFTEFGCALAGATLVGLNPTRTGAFLAHDLTYADCQIVVVEDKYAVQLRAALDSDPAAHVKVYRASGVPAASSAAAGIGWQPLDVALHGVPADDPQVNVSPTDQLMIIFTSGTTKAPKGVLNSHGRLMMLGYGASLYMCKFTPADTVYAAMPLFHANAQILAVVPALIAGGCIALARRFSKTQFLPDVRKYGATLFNYVGTPFAYIMDTLPRPDDADNPLRLAYGNEAPRQYIETFGSRFACEVIDGYGASEVGVGFSRVATDPPRSLGRAPGVNIVNDEGQECPPAEFSPTGVLLNPDAAVGEMVNTAGPFMFEGYYKDDASTRERTRNGWFYTGDLGYKDTDGFIYFAGRDAEWIRVGGENFLARPIEEILCRYPEVMLASVYGVPDPEAGDQVMATLKLRTGTTFDSARFTAFVDGAADLPPRWRPTFVRVAEEVAVTHTNKVLKRVLRREKFRLDRVRDPIFWRPRGGARFQPFTADDLAALRARFEHAGHLERLDE